MVNYAYTANGIPSKSINEALSIMEENIFLYKGYIYDYDTNMYYCMSRYYDPEIGRWLSIDDVGYLDSQSVHGLNLYAYCRNNPVMYTDGDGTSPQRWEWVISGAQLALGIGLMFVPGAQVFGVGLIVSGTSMLASYTMSAMGLDDKLSMQIQSGLNLVAGIGLSFVPGLGAIGASMIGAGVVSFAGGYISEAFGGSYALGWGIGNIVGSIAGGMVYKGIINKLNTPARMIKSFENHPQRWKLVNQDIGPATGRAYRGGVSNYSNYRNIWTNSCLGTHVITRGNAIIHGPHYRLWW